MKIFIVLLVVLGIFVFASLAERKQIKCFSENGELLSVTHVDRKGLPHGEQITFYLSGEVCEHLQFVHGRLVKGFMFSENGELLVRYYEDENLELCVENVK